MSWKKRHRSFYYKYAEDPNDIVLKSSETAHLIIDVQKTYLEPKENQKENEEWQPFFNRMKDLVIPNIKSFISFTREKKVENIFARIACHKESGLDRSLSQKKPGFNYLLLPSLFLCSFLLNSFLFRCFLSLFIIYYQFYYSIFHFLLSYFFF